MHSIAGIIMLITGAIIAMLLYLYMKRLEYALYKRNDGKFNKGLKKILAMESRVTAIMLASGIMAMCFPITHNSMVDDFVAMVIKGFGLIYTLGSILWTIYKIYKLNLEKYSD